MRLVCKESRQTAVRMLAHSGMSRDSVREKTNVTQSREDLSGPLRVFLPKKEQDLPSATSVLRMRCPINACRATLVTYLEQFSERDPAHAIRCHLL